MGAVCIQIIEGNPHLRLYIDGYLACLRRADVLEPFLIHRLEEEISRFLYDTSNFETPLPQPEAKPNYRRW
ncbi:MAG: DUF6761 family protein [Cyanobacteria bacterium J06629_9]